MIFTKDEKLLIDAYSKLPVKLSQGEPWTVIVREKALVFYSNFSRLIEQCWQGVKSSNFMTL